MPEKINGLGETMRSMAELDDEEVFDEQEIDGVDAIALPWRARRYGQVVTERYCAQERNKLLDFESEV